MQDSADESHAVEIHALNTHTHIQPAPAKEMPIPTKRSFDQQIKVCVVLEILEKKFTYKSEA